MMKLGMQGVSITLASGDSGVAARSTGKSHYSRISRKTLTNFQMTTMPMAALAQAKYSTLTSPPLAPTSLPCEQLTSQLGPT
jgi:hypothetical protein